MYGNHYINGSVLIFGVLDSTKDKTRSFHISRNNVTGLSGPELINDIPFIRSDTRMINGAIKYVSVWRYGLEIADVN